MRVISPSRMRAERFGNRLLRWTAAICIIFVFLVARTTLAGTFGTVVPIGGHASDIALDEPRGVVYVANFTANRIDVVSIANRKVQTSINVSRQPAALALSPDGRHLLITHLTAAAVGNNSLTAIELTTNARRTFAFGAVPLGVAFLNHGKALVVTTTEILMFDPVTGYSVTIATVPSAALLPPQPSPCQPREFVQAKLVTSGDGTRVWGVAATVVEDGCQETDPDKWVIFRYDASAGLRASFWTSSPPMAPRSIATDHTGSVATTGWGMFHASGMFEIAEWLRPAGQYEIGGYAIDSARGIAYGHVSKGVLAGQTPGQNENEPELIIADADNLTVRERLRLAENFAGPAVLDSRGENLYAVSQSGITILPVGSLNAQHRVAATQEDVLFRGNWCDGRTMTQEITIQNPGGGRTPFSVSTNMPGVRLSTSQGMTPAKVNVVVDSYAYRNLNGTAQGLVRIQSGAAVNVIPPVRILVNNREPDQRGTMVNIPGTLVDLAADAVRGRLYVLRQDKNEVQVFDSRNLTRTGTLRTQTTPSSMAVTPDGKYLIVGVDNAQVASVYELDTMRFLRWIVFPGGHYPRSIAASNRAILAASRVAGERECESRPTHAIDRIDLVNGFATELPALGVWSNCVHESTQLTAAPGGDKILAVQPDGTVMLYDAEVDDFTVGRQDLTELKGAFGAISGDQFIVDNMLLNSSLVPIAPLGALGQTSGVIVSDGIAIRTAAASSSTNGMIERVSVQDGGIILGARLTEAPLLPDATIAGRAFTRTLTALPNRTAFAVLSTSGLTVLPWDYDAAIAVPQIDSVVNAADRGQAVAPGGLISILGKSLSPVNAATSETPLPTLLGDSCLTVNGQLVPIVFVSPGQINGQLPFGVISDASMVLHTPSGVSNTFKFPVRSNAPGVFLLPVEGWTQEFPSVYRASNNQIATLSNPVHLDDWLVIYLTGMGQVAPDVVTGEASPMNPLAEAAVKPEVKLGGVSLPVWYAGLTPGSVGVYQINVHLPFKGVPTGMEVPLTITQGDYSTTIKLRVVD